MASNLETKSDVRQRVWRHLTDAGLARFPFPVAGRIPNFDGAVAAAARLASHPVYLAATYLKCNPDSPQRPLRQRALEDGKTVFMAVPRLRDEKCFIRLDPSVIDPSLYKRAATIGGSAELGVPVRPDEMPSIDLVSAGSVAVAENGARVGKGGGYSDLEFALTVELGLIRDDTAIVTTVHDDQVIDASWPFESHDVPLDWIFTPTRAVECVAGTLVRPEGVLWEKVTDEMRQDIPLLARGP